MTIVIIILAGVGLWVIARNSAAMSAATTQPERSKRWRATLFACAGVLALLFLMRGAGFVAGIGLLLPALAIGAIVATVMVFMRVVRPRG
jgi:hypothetical protein